jgi:hypothetical protein
VIREKHLHGERRERRGHREKKERKKERKKKRQDCWNAELEKMLFRIRKPNTAATTSEEPEAGWPAGTGEEWLGRNRSAKRRLWERLNPRHRKELRMIAEALAMQQTHANLPEPLRARLSESIEQVERLARRIGVLLAEVTRRTLPRS